MTERMTDAQFHAEIDQLDKQGRHALAMLRAVREADRARASETEKDAQIKALADALEEVRDLKSAVAVWLEDGKEVSLLDQIDAALRLAGRLP